MDNDRAMKRKKWQGLSFIIGMRK